MTATDTTTRTSTPVPAPVAALPQPVTLGRATASEWVKFRTLRSSWAVLGGAVLGMVAIALIVAYNTRQLTPQIQTEDSVASATMQGYYLGQLLIGALGVLFVTGEYGTGMIRSTFAAVPARLPVVWAKLAVFVAVVATSMIAACLVAFVSAQALLSAYRPGYSLGDPGVLRVVLGTGVYLTLVGLLGGAIGWLVRSTPGALVTFFAVILVVPVLVTGVLGQLGRDVGQYLPSEAGRSFVSSLPDPTSLSPWVGLAVLVAWVVGALALAAATLRRRDV